MTTTKFLANVPTFPQEGLEFIIPNDLTGSSAFPPRPTPEDLSISSIPRCFTTKNPFTFDVRCNDSSFDAKFLVTQILLRASHDGAHVPSQSLRASTRLDVLPTGNGVRISIAPGWFSGARTLTIDGLSLAGAPLSSPLLPAQVVVVNHAPSARGALWDAAFVGDAAGVENAILSGCSTGEVDEVRLIF